MYSLTLVCGLTSSTGWVRGQLGDDQGGGWGEFPTVFLSSFMFDRTRVHASLTVMIKREFSMAQ